MTIESGSRAFQLVAGHPALDLVNTLDWRFREGEPEELLISYSDLVRFAAQSELLTAKEARQLERTPGAETDQKKSLDAARALREALAIVLYAKIDGRKPAEAQLAQLDRIFKTAHAGMTLRWSGDGARWEWPLAGAGFDLLQVRLARSAESLLTLEDLAMMRACAKPDCRWLFLDTSKNHTRRWCDMKLCGNRMKARRFKAQHKDEE